MSHDFSIETLESRRLLASVAIDVNDVAQTFKGMGGNYTQAHFRSYAHDVVGDYNTANLDPKHVRVAIPMIDWEPVNDNADASSFNFAGFKDTGKITTLFKMIKEFNDAGRTVTASVFDLPDWMVSNPEKENQRLIKPGFQAEVAESIAAFVKRAKDVYGASIQFLGFNEVDGGYDVRLTSQENADLIEMTGTKLAGLGFSPKWLVGDTYRVQGTVDYAKGILDDAGAAPFLGPIAFHSWWSESIPESDWRAMRTLADQYGKELWCDEMHYYALAPQQTPWIFPTWQGARRLALITAKVLKWAEADLAMYWQYQNDFPLMNSTATDQYYSYHVIKSFNDNLKAGSQIVGATSDKSSIFALAGKDVARDHFAAFAINSNTTVDAPPESVTFTGLPNQALTLTRNSINNKSVVVGTFTPVNGTLTLSLAADAMYTLSGKLGTVVQPPPPPPTGQLPAGWSGTNVGYNQVKGSSGFGNGVFTVKGAGIDIGGTADQFHFANRTMSGNGQIVARVTGIGNTNAAAKAGVMIRETNSASSKMAALVFTPSGGLFSIVRNTAGKAAVVTQLSTNTIPHWLKIVRSGNTFTFHGSANGTTWAPLGTTSITMASAVQTGLAVTSKAPKVLNTSTFSDVSVTGAVTQPPPTPGALAATADAFVRDGGFATTNYGQNTELHAKNDTLADARRESLLKFDLSGVATINSAKLRLFGRLSDTSAATVHTQIFKSTGILWSEDAVTWSTRPGSAGGSHWTTAVTGTTARWYEWDVTALMKYEKDNGRNVVGLVLRNVQTTGPFTLFNSGEAAANAPQLVIT